MVKKYFCRGPIYWTIVVSFTLGMWVNIAESATYYVAKNGSNSNAGTEAAPWLTINKSASTVVAGDTVLVKAGTYQDGTITVTNSGTAQAPITFKTYGDGEVIIQNTYRIVTSGWTLTSGTVYEITEPNTPANIAQLDSNQFFGTWATTVANVAAVEVSSGPVYYYDSGAQRLHIKLVSGWGFQNPNDHPVIIIYQNISAFDLNSKSYITIDGFQINGPNPGFANSGSNNTFRNCTVSYIVGGTGGADDTLINNLFYFCYRGIDASNAGAVTIQIIHNTYYVTNNRAVTIGGTSPPCVIKNNIFNAGGSDGGESVRISSFVPTVLDYNLHRLISNGNFSVFMNSTSYSSLATLQATGKETRGLGNADPQFISTTAGSVNLDLQSTSPCIGAADDGLNLGVYFRPSSPTGLTASKPAGTSKKPTVTISWNSVVRSSNKIDGYNIYRSNNSDTGYTLIGTVAGETTTTYKDESPLTGNSYYKVRAYKKTTIIDIESWYSSSVQVYMPSPKTTVPAGQGAEISAFFDEKTKIIIPADILKRELIFSIDKVLSLPGSTIETAKVVSGIEFKVEDTKENAVKELEGLVTIVIHTTSSDGIYVDETDPKVKKEEVGNKLIIGYWNGLLWIPMTNTSKVWLSGNDIYVSANTNHFSTYGIMTKGSSKISEIGVRVFPNPVTPASSDSRFNKVTFVFENKDNDSVEIKIWDLTAGLVRELKGMPGITTMEWDCRNEYGDIVEGGVYIWQIKIGNSLAGKGTIIIAK